MKADRESTVLAAVLEFLERHPKVAWVKRMNTGMASLKGFRVRFGFVGCSDILGQLRDGRFIAVECKALAGRLSIDQAQFLELVREHRGVAGVVRSVEDAQALLATT